jgi:hypothetical protein
MNELVFLGTATETNARILEAINKDTQTKTKINNKDPDRKLYNN